jgi:hypothetical protein
LKWNTRVGAPGDALRIERSLVAATPKPRLVKLTMAVAGTEPFSIVDAITPGGLNQIVLGLSVPGCFWSLEKERTFSHALIS